MTKFLILSAVAAIAFTGCGKKGSSGCTAQNTSSTEIIINCKTLRKEASTCNSRTVSSSTVSQNEVCYMGFDLNCSQAKIDPPSIKPSLDNGTITLRSKTSGKKILLKSVSSGGDSFLIIQHEGDTGDTSSVDLPVCGDLGS